MKTSKILLTILLFTGLSYAQTNFLNPFIPATNQEQNATVLPETNETNTSIETNTTLNMEYNETNETNVTIEQTETFKDNFVTVKPSIKFAIVANKKKFFKYLPSLLNSIIAYLDNKNIEYNMTLYSIDTNLSEITKKYKDIIYLTADKNKIYQLKDYNATFFVPTFNINDFNETFKNVYFGGINYKTQIQKLISYMDAPNAVAINEDTEISNRLYNLEKEENLSLTKYMYPYINYDKLNDNYIFFNTSAGNTAQVLSKITYKNINPKLEFGAQINYDPLLLAITQPQDVQKLLIANSIISVPAIIEDEDMLLGSDIRYNWLNYATSILVNKIYNLQTNGYMFYMNDFNMYIFGNQINYKTKLYQIINRTFRTISQ